jgi:hypothetical protein
MMDMPKEYELCKWINERYISGLEIIYDYSDYDQCISYWILKDNEGKTKKVIDKSIQNLVDISPEYNSILRLKDDIPLKLENYGKFIKKNARELSEYKRLKAKFESQKD